MRPRHFTAGTLIFSEGDPSNEAYILRKGRVEVLTGTARGAYRLAVLGEGDVLGEMGLLEERARSASARALEDVVADAVSADEFNAMLLRDPSKSMAILRALFERLRNMNQRLSEQASAVVAGTRLPRAKLLPLTPQTRAVLPAAGLDIPRFPFRIGRKPEMSEMSALHFNELEISDRLPYVLSLHHFAIDLAPEGVVVRDRGSKYGTLVNGSPIGAGVAQDFAALRPGDNEIVAGAVLLPPRHESPFRFLVQAH